MSTIKGFNIQGTDLQYQDPNLASEFSTSKTYKVGEYCFNDGQLYRCVTAITTTGITWNSSNWTAVKLADDTNDLKSAVDSTTDLFSDEKTLLSDALTDGTGTHAGVNYTLTGNTLSATGVSTGNSLYTLIATTTPPPDWIIPGKKYIVSVETTGRNPSISIQIKDTVNTSIHTLVTYATAGKYVLEIPNNITAFRIVSLNRIGADLNGSITTEISNVLEVPDHIEFPVDVTELSSIRKTGFYHINSNRNSNITDLPDGINSNSNSDLLVFEYAATTTQILINHDTSGRGSLFIWKRNIGGSNEAWAFCNASVNLTRYGSDADIIPINGFFGWGSSDAVSNVPSRVGMIVNLIRDLNTGYQLAFNYTAESLSFRVKKSGVWGEWIWLKAENKKIAIKHEAGSYASGKATERISIYIPAFTGYIMYRLYHFVDNDNNCNGWQIYHIYHVDDLDNTNQTDLTVTGEYECAIHLAERDDFSGGHTHGDEVMNNVAFLMNGAPVTASTLTVPTSCEEFKIIQTSTMYDPNDSTTQIALHGKEYVFTSEGLTLNQSLKWLVAEALTNCFLAMFLPSKNYIDRASANSDFELLELPSSIAEPLTTITKQNANAVTMWDTASGFSADVSIPVYPTGLTGGDLISIGDNNGKNYNKLYFKICGGGTSSIGELWKSTTIYKLNYTV